MFLGRRSLQIYAKVDFLRACYVSGSGPAGSVLERERILLLLTVALGRDGTTPKTVQPPFENSPITGSFSSREALVQPEFGLLPKKYRLRAWKELRQWT